MKEIPLRERIVAALQPGEEYQRAEGILLSDWTLAAVKQREEERRRKEQVEPTLVALKPREEEWGAIASRVSDWNLAFRQKEEERRRKEQAAEAAVVTSRPAEVAEVKIVDEKAEAARRPNDEWREPEEPEYILHALEDSRQRELEETPAVPKSGIVRSRGKTRVIRGVLSTLTTVAIAGGIGFGAGVYATPPDKADEFRAFVNSKLKEIDRLIQREWAAIVPQAKAPSDAATPRAPEATSKEAEPAVPAQPASEVPASDADGQKDMPDVNAAAPSAGPAETSTGESAAPVPSAEPAAPAMSETPSSAEDVSQAKPVAKKAPVATAHPNPPVKQAKPKAKPKPKPAEQAPAAAEPAQQ